MTEPNTELVSPSFFEVVVPLGNSDWHKRQENPHFVGLRRFFAAVFESDYSEAALDAHGMSQITFAVHKIGPRFLEIAVWADAPKEIDANVSGEIGDLLRLTPEIGIMIGPVTSMTAKLLFCDYDAMAALRMSRYWHDWLSTRPYYDTLKAEWQRENERLDSRAYERHI